jgi:sulfur carrier protein
MCEFTLNGAPHALADGSSLLDLIDVLALRDQALALAVNRAVVPRQRWREVALAGADRVDIVRAIGGG